MLSFHVDLILKRKKFQTLINVCIHYMERAQKPNYILYVYTHYIISYYVYIYYTISKNDITCDTMMSHVMRPFFSLYIYIYIHMLGPIFLEVRLSEGYCCVGLCASFDFSKMMIYIFFFAEIHIM